MENRIVHLALLALGVSIAIGIHAAAHSHHHGQQQAPAPAPTQQQVETNRMAATSLPVRDARHAHGERRLIDLSHPLSNDTLHWPKNKGIQLSMDIDTDSLTPSGSKYHARSDSVNMATHVGTHLDAPSHFARDGWSVEKIPLERLIDVPVTVVDLSEKVKANRSYSFLKSDFVGKDGKPVFGAKSVVLVYTGISQAYDGGLKAYVGIEKGQSISLMKSPGFSFEAAQYLVEGGVYGVGLDAISADSSERQADENKYDPQAHVLFNTKNVYILENVNKNLKDLVHEPAAKLTIAPLPFVGGTGSPVRLVAILGHDDCHCSVSNGAPGESRGHWAFISTLIFCILVFMF